MLDPRSPFTGAQLPGGLDAFNSMDVEDELFQGAPLLARMDTGDAFDRLLQRWLSSSELMAPLDSPPAHALQQQTSLPYLTSGQQQLQGAHEHRPPAQQGSQGASQQYLLEIEQQLQQMSELDQTPAQQGRQGLPQPYREPVSSAPQRPRTQQGAIVIQLPGGVPTAAGAHSFDEMRPAAYSTPPVSLAQEAAIQLGSQQVVIRPSVDSLLPTTTGGAPQQHVSGRPRAISPLSTTSGESMPQTENSRLNLAAGILATMPGENGSIEAARNAWPKRKRGPTSEASKEKERARNRRAQKRFREREKERQEVRQNALATLESELVALTKAKEELERRNASLEQAMAVRQEQQRFDAQPATFDPQFWLEAGIDDPSDLLPRITVGPAPRQFTEEEISGMSYEQHIALYKEYVDALAAQLRGPPTHEQNNRIAELIQEVCGLNMAIAMSNPNAYTRFQSGRLDGKEVEPLQPGRDVWQRCLAALNLSNEQKAALLQERRKFMKRLSPLVKQRWVLHRLMADNFAKDDCGTMQRATHSGAVDAVERLRENLYEEQVLLVQTMCATHQMILTPQQVAAHFVTAYPYFPDVPQLVDIFASQNPGEPTTAELLGIDALPPK